MQEHRRAALLLAGTALLWSTGGLAIKSVNLSPMAVTGGRSLFSALTLLALFGGRLDFALTPARVGAAVAYAALLVTSVAATKMTTAANAILLAYTAPIYVALLAPVFLGEKTCRADWLFIAASLGGMALFFLDRLSPSGVWGNLLAVSTGLSYAVFTVCMRAGRDGQDGSLVSAVIVGHGLTALAGLPFLVGQASVMTVSDLLGLGYLGLVQQGGSLALYVWCIKRLQALEAMCLLMLEPIFNPIFVALGYGELPGFWAVLGGLVVIGAVILRGMIGSGRRPEPEPA